MKKFLLGVIILSVALVVFFILQTRGEEIKSPNPIPPSEYHLVVSDLESKIDDLSPTPPTEDDFIIQSISFAKDTNLAYVIYHDTHNIFRILVEIEKPTGKYQYRTRAVFEKTSSGWQKKFGEDLAQDQELIEIKE